MYICSENGDKAEEFHRRCDGKSPTIVLIKTEDNFKLGGYTSAQWSSDNHYKEDSTAFIFSLSNKKSFKVNNSRRAIYGGISCGPNFGDREIFINNNCFTKGGTIAKSNYYELYNTGELVGSKKDYKIKDYEVFLIK